MSTLALFRNAGDTRVFVKDNPGFAPEIMRNMAVRTRSTNHRL